MEKFLRTFLDLKVIVIKEQPTRIGYAGRMHLNPCIAIWASSNVAGPTLT